MARASRRPAVRSPRSRRSVCSTTSWASRSTGTGSIVRVQGFDAELAGSDRPPHAGLSDRRRPAALAGLAVAPLAPTAAQREQGVVSVATAHRFARGQGVRQRGPAPATTAWMRLVRYRSRRVGRSTRTTRTSSATISTRRVRFGGCRRSRASSRCDISRAASLSWIEASASVCGAQDALSGGDITDERIGAARRQERHRGLLSRRTDQPVPPPRPRWARRHDRRRVRAHGGNAGADSRSRAAASAPPSTASRLSTTALACRSTRDAWVRVGQRAGGPDASPMI